MKLMKRTMDAMRTAMSSMSSLKKGTKVVGVSLHVKDGESVAYLGVIMSVSEDGVFVKCLPPQTGVHMLNRAEAESLLKPVHTIGEAKELIGRVYGAALDVHESLESFNDSKLIPETLDKSNDNSEDEDDDSPTAATGLQNASNDDLVYIAYHKGGRRISDFCFHERFHPSGKYAVSLVGKIVADYGRRFRIEVVSTTNPAIIKTFRVDKTHPRLGLLTLDNYTDLPTHIQQHLKRSGATIPVV